jgi:hypothetical protein
MKEDTQQSHGNTRTNAGGVFEWCRKACEKAANRNEALSVSEKDRLWTGKRTCKSTEKEHAEGLLESPTLVVGTNPKGKAQLRMLHRQNYRPNVS